MRIVSRLVLLVLMIMSFVKADNLDMDMLANKAKEENKQLMFFFHIPGCPYCKSMLKENFKDKETLAEIEKNFILVDIYTGDDGVVTSKDFKGSKKEFAKSMKVFTYPTTQFRTPSLKLIHEARGYRNIDEYLPEIKYISSRAYKRIDLETFAEELEFAEDD